MADDNFVPGLAGVVAAKSAIGYINGQEGVLRYRGITVQELAEKSTNGVLTPEEHEEYAEAVRLNDTLSLLKLQAEEFWTMRAAS